MSFKRKLLLSSTFVVLMTTQAFASFNFYGMTRELDDKVTSSTSAQSTSMPVYKASEIGSTEATSSSAKTTMAISNPVADFLNDFRGDTEAAAFLGYFWETLSQTAKKVTQDFIAQPLNTIFNISEDQSGAKLETKRTAIFGTLGRIPKMDPTDTPLSEMENYKLLTFISDLKAFDVKSANAKIKIGAEIQKLLNDQTDLLKNYYLTPLETGEVDEETDLTQSLRKTVSDANVSPARRAELELRKQFALNNFRHLLEYGQNSIALDRDMFVNLIQDAMTTKALLSKDVGTWTNFKLNDLAEPFALFELVPSETSAAASKGKDKAAVTSKVYEMLPIILADENEVDQPEAYKHPFVEMPTAEIAAVTSKKTKIDDIRVKPEAETETVQINVTEDGEHVHDYMMGFATYTPRQHKGTPMPVQSSTGLFWRMLGYK